MSERPTPDTDRFIIEETCVRLDSNIAKFMRQLERDRDFARCEVDRYREEKDLLPISWNI